MLIQQLLQIKSLKEGAVKTNIMDTIEDICRNPDLPSKGMSYEAAIKHIVKKIQSTHTMAAELPPHELEGYVKDYMTEDDFEELHEDAFDQGGMGEPGEDEHHHDQDATPSETKVIGKAAEFKVELDGDEQVHILDGEGTIRLSMPFMIWKQLTRG